ncbi:hypothetical protein QCA50_000977 [Cerrena zonata]|uniref:Uncharacterized protein n=1 Tax=Cerrena zonata TaxID=2478898 RepID=A0AAW0GSC3_9APHY
MRTLLADGNFKQEHLKMKAPHDDVALSDGHGYLVTKAPFERYISEAPPLKVQASTCHEHDAVKNQNASRAHLDATGIGCIACGRHGCFYPHSAVNFQKGEGHRYMDYAFVNAINYIPAILLILMLYDIMCQFWINFLNRVRNSAGHLSLPGNMTIQRGIGLFHVHGHIKQCYTQFAPTFIQGAGQVDGEVVETLWSVLNHTASSARAMTWNHRQEYLDWHMADSNWKKLTGMVQALLRKWKVCQVQVLATEDYFQQLCATVGEEKTKEYTELEAELQRLRVSDVTVMNQMDVLESKLNGKAEMQTELEETEEETGLARGSASWLAAGIRLEEEQISILRLAAKLGKKAKKDQDKSLVDKRTRFDIPQSAIESGWFDGDDLADDTPITSFTHSDSSNDAVSANAEMIALPLPSSFGADMCQGRLRSLARCEAKLREGQANDALDSLRVAIAKKSFVARTKLRPNAPTSNYVKRLRSYGDLHLAQIPIDRAAKVYSTARHALIILGATDALQQFKLLTKEDLKASTAVVDSNAPHQGKDLLSWIWHIGRSDNSPPVITELYRVNWLRAKCRRDRWAEEKILLRSELSWTHNYFRNRAETWKLRASDTRPGHASHALRQANTWYKFATYAKNALQSIGELEL